MKKVLYKILTSSRQGGTPQDDGGDEAHINADLIKKLIEAICLVIIFLTPILPSSFGLGYEQVKVFFFIFGTSIAVFFYFLGLQFFPKDFKFSWTKLKILAGIFILFLAITSFWGLNFERSSNGVTPYFQGLISYFYLYLFFLLISSLKLSPKKIAITLAVSSLIISVVAIGDFIKLHLLAIDVITYSGRVVSTFGQPSFYAGFILIVMPFSLYLFKDSHKEVRVLAVSSLVVGVIAILTSFSRSPIIMMVGIIYVYLLSQTNFFKRALTLSILGIVFYLVFSWYFSNGIIYREFIQPLYSYQSDVESYEKRIYIWQITSQLFLEKPLLGYGLENLDLGYKQFFKNINFNINQPFYYHTLKDLVVNRSHSYFLDILFYSGILGLVSFLLLIFQALKTKRILLKSCLIIFLAFASIQVLSIIHLIYFWLILGLIDSSVTDNV